VRFAPFCGYDFLTRLFLRLLCLFAAITIPVKKISSLLWRLMNFFSTLNPEPFFFVTLGLGVRNLIDISFQAAYIMVTTSMELNAFTWPAVTDSWLLL